MSKSTDAVAAMSATVGDAADLLDVHVDHVAGVVPLVAVHGALGLAGRAVHVLDLVQAVAHEDAVHGRGGDVDAVSALGQERADASGSPLLVDADLQHHVDDVVGGAVGAALGARGAVLEPFLAVDQPPLVPAAQGGRGRGRLQLRRGRWGGRCRFARTGGGGPRGSGVRWGGWSCHPPVPVGLAGAVAPRARCVVHPDGIGVILPRSGACGCHNTRVEWRYDTKR